MDTNLFPIRGFVRKLGLMLKGEYVVAFGIDLSEAVIRVRVKDEVPAGTSGVATFRIPDSDFIIARGAVTKCERDPQGPFIELQFHDLSLLQKRKIREFIAARSK